MQCAKCYLNKLPLYSITNKDVGYQTVMENGRHNFCLSYPASDKSHHNGATYSQKHWYPSILWKGAATDSPGWGKCSPIYLPVKDLCWCGAARVVPWDKCAIADSERAPAHTRLIDTAVSMLASHRSWWDVRPLPSAANSATYRDWWHGRRVSGSTRD